MGTCQGGIEGGVMAAPGLEFLGHPLVGQDWTMMWKMALPVQGPEAVPPDVWQGTDSRKEGRGRVGRKP